MLRSARQIAWWVPLAVLAACSEQPDNRAGSGGPAGQPKQLAEHHPGWGDPGCPTCHKLPEPGHTATLPQQCAACHGANAACDPNGENSQRTGHAPTNDCASCHQDQHGMPKTTPCASCHFASSGVIACPPPAALPPDGLGVPHDGGVSPGDGPSGDGSSVADGTTGTAPVLAATLQGGCLGWPAQDFSASNKTAWKVSVGPGQLAVDFSLKDTAGKSYTLSQLLGEKPVWLQLGSFT